MFHTPSTSVSPGRHARCSSGPQRARGELGPDRPVDAKADPRPILQQQTQPLLDFLLPLPALGRRHAGAQRQQALSLGPPPSLELSSLHFDARNQKRPVMRPSSVTSMLLAAGVRESPGKVMISPQIATTNSAPADSRTSRTLSTWPLGGPLRLGSVEKLY